jgi:hypothetical protein
MKLNSTGQLELSEPEPGVYGSMTVFPMPDSLNETPEEQTWPLVDYSLPKRGRFTPILTQPNKADSERTS